MHTVLTMEALRIREVATMIQVTKNIRNIKNNNKNKNNKMSTANPGRRGATAKAL